MTEFESVVNPDPRLLERIEKLEKMEKIHCAMVDRHCELITKLQRKVSKLENK